MLIKSGKHLLILYCSILILIQGGVVHAASAEKPLDTPQIVDSAPSSSTTATDTASADLLPTTEPPIFPQALDKGCDIVILIDASDSITMADPSNFRKDGLKLFISLLSEDDRVSIMRFGKDATALSPLMQNTEQNRPALFNELERRISLDRFLPVTEAVQRGYEELGRSARRNRILILLTDGKTAPDAHVKDAVAQAGMKALMPRLIAERIKLYAIAFHADSERERLASLARETGGDFHFIQTAEDLHLAFSSIYELVKTPDTLPVANDVFAIDSDIREATVLISKKTGSAVSLVSPSGTQESLARHSRQLAWYASTVYDLVTIRNPLPGTWRIVMGRSEGGKVYLRTELRLGTALDKPRALSGENIRIDAWLEKKGVIVAEPGTLGLISLTAAAIGPDGNMQSLRLVAPSDTGTNALKTGAYSGMLSVHREGVYRVKISAAGKTFFREKDLVLAVAGSPEGQPQNGRASRQGEISWWSVLVRFALVNCAAALLIGIIFVIRTEKLKTTLKRAKK